MGEFLLALLAALLVVAIALSAVLAAGALVLLASAARDVARTVSEYLEYRR